MEQQCSLLSHVVPDEPIKACSALQGTVRLDTDSYEVGTYTFIVFRCSAHGLFIAIQDSGKGAELRDQPIALTNS